MAPDTCMRFRIFVLVSVAFATNPREHLGVSQERIEDEVIGLATFDPTTEISLSVKRQFAGQTLHHQPGSRLVHFVLGKNGAIEKDKVVGEKNGEFGNADGRLGVTLAQLLHYRYQAALARDVLSKLDSDDVVNEEDLEHYHQLGERLGRVAEQINQLAAVPYVCARPVSPAVARPVMIEATTTAPTTFLKTLALMGDDPTSIVDDYFNAGAVWARFVEFCGVDASGMYSYELLRYWNTHYRELLADAVPVLTSTFAHAFLTIEHRADAGHSPSIALATNVSRALSTICDDGEDLPIDERLAECFTAPGGSAADGKLDKFLFLAWAATDGADWRAAVMQSSLQELSFVACLITSRTTELLGAYSPSWCSLEPAKPLPRQGVVQVNLGTTPLELVRNWMRAAGVSDVASLPPVKRAMTQRP
ncbi:hypothetical protein GNI_001410 [Gregarina niphandrodes]|uniref:Transmembrane protein n=1 Tax=Gregarina niphandrodes TaxID=110365 RepID=A0A023BDS8_GRENI|nr:hypothetical protein GNI_001410 [Gregarina niphandrodes]EZG89664.1 hypothetical protein GNI_001410 [Gregarina niphandrodes]|eukprot:XP_011128470.1 hypothetical protein GNI_001410 [Gregarina niphandrodes]